MKWSFFLVLWILIVVSIPDLLKASAQQCQTIDYSIGNNNPICGNGNSATLDTPANNAVLFSSMAIANIQLTWQDSKTCNIGFLKQITIFYKMSNAGSYQSKLAESANWGNFPASIEGPYTYQIYHACVPTFINGENNNQCWIDRANKVCTSVAVVCLPPKEPSLTGPFNDAVYPESHGTVYLSWNPYTSNHYQCNVAQYYSYTVGFFNSSDLTKAPVHTVTVNGLYSNGVNVSLKSLPGFNKYYWSVMVTREVPAEMASGNRISIIPYTNVRTFIYCATDAPPAKASLVFPLHDSIIGNSMITFSWDPPSHWGATCYPTTHRYIVSINGPTTINLSAAKEVTSHTVQTLIGGSYWWHIQTDNGIGYTTWSETYSFTVCATSPPTSFSLVSPTNNQVDVDYTSVQFEWGESFSQGTCQTGETIQYILYWRKSENDNFELGKNTTDLTATLTLPESGVYFWKVVARQGSLSVSSSTFSFTTTGSSCTPVDPTTPTIHTPVVSYINPALMKVTVEWDPINFGASCNDVRKRDDSANTLAFWYGDDHTEVTLNPQDVTYEFEVPPGILPFGLLVTNEDSVTASASSSISICDVQALHQFASHLTPEDDAILYTDTVSLEWSLPTIPATCVGNPTYDITVLKGNITMRFQNDVTSPFSVTLSEGSWTWTLTANYAQINVIGIPSFEVSQSFHICVPAAPNVPIRAYPPIAWQVNGNSVQLRWRLDSDSWGIDYCSILASQGILIMNKHFEVLVGERPSDLYVEETCNKPAVDGVFEYSCALDNLNSGPLFWRVVATKSYSRSSVVVSNLTSETTNGLFGICTGSTPLATTIIGPDNDIKLSRCDTTLNFRWHPLNISDFGESCMQFNPSFELRIGTSATMLNELVVTQFYDTVSLNLDMLSLSPSKKYYWQVVSFNGQLSSATPVRSFTTGPYDIEACSGHGQCKNGGCACDIGYKGAQCQSGISGQGDGSLGANPGSMVGIGIGVALALVILIAFLILFIVFQRKVNKQREKAKLLGKKPPPDFAEFAFTPIVYPPSLKEHEASWKGFEQLIVATGFPLIQCILDELDISDADDTIKAMIYVCEAHMAAGPLLKLFVDREIMEKKETNTLTPQTIFRENSFASKGFKFYSKITCLPYLFHTLSDPVWDIVVEHSPYIKNQSMKSTSSLRKKNSEGNMGLTDVVVTVRRGESAKTKFAESMETDPAKLTEGEDANVNSLALQIEAQSLLVRVFRSVSVFPYPVREVLAYILDTVTANLTNEDGYIAVGSFIFLRLINPSILFPNQYGLVEELPNDPPLTRHLVLLTKALQNLANGVEFGKKEAHMQSLNSFLEDNRAKLRKFLEEIVSLSHHEEEIAEFTPVEVPRKVVEMSLMHLYAYVYRRQNKILERFQKYCHNNEPTRKLLVNRFLCSINELGEPTAPLGSSLAKK